MDSSNLRRPRAGRIVTALTALTTAMAGLAAAATTPALAATTPIKVAVLGAPSTPAWNAEVQAKLAATGLFAQVDAIDIHRGRPVPTLTRLRRYGAVLVYSDAPIDGTALGDVLADFADLGRGVTVATFGLYSPTDQLGLGLAGRLVTGSYLPFDTSTAGQSGGLHLHLVTRHPTAPLLCGVTSFDGGRSSYHNTVTVAAGAHQVARWSNAAGVPLEAWKAPVLAGGGRVVGLNLYPPSSDSRSDLWTAGTDGTRLMADALLFSAHRSTGCP